MEKLVQSPSNLVTFKQQHISSHSAHKSRIWAQVISGSLPRLLSGVGGDSSLVWMIDRGRICFQAHSRDVADSSWACDQRPLSVPCQAPSLSRQPHTKESERGSARKVEAATFCNLISEGASHLCYCILLTRSKSIGPTHTQWKGIITQSHLHQGAGGTGSHDGRPLTARPLGYHFSIKTLSEHFCHWLSGDRSPRLAQVAGFGRWLWLPLLIL